MNIIKFRLPTDQETSKLQKITIEKGHYVLFKTGANNCVDCVEVGDLLMGIWIKDGQEVFGTAQYKGPDKYNMDSYGLITDFTF